jgi:hypothetical protein
MRSLVREDAQSELVHYDTACLVCDGWGNYIVYDKSDNVCGYPDCPRCQGTGREPIPYMEMFR